MGLTAADVLTQTDIESEIVRLASLLEEATTELGSALEDNAIAEADWSIAEALVFYNYDGPEWRARAAARVSHEEKYRLHKTAHAKAEHMKEKCRQIRGQLDAVRTLSANVRVQT